MDRYSVEPIRLPVALCEVPVARAGELHHIVHPQQAQEVLGILVQRLQVAHKVILNLARMAELIHLVPVLIKGHLLLCPRVEEVLDKLGEGWPDTHLERLVHIVRGRWLVAVAAQHYLSKAPVKFAVGLLKFIPEGRNEAYEGVPHKKKLGVLL